MDGTDRNGTLNILFQTIGEQHLETDAARALSVPEPGELPAVNGPAISIRGGAFEYGLKDHLMDQGVDLEVPEHSALLVLIDEIKAKLRLNEPSRPPIEDISGAVAELRRLATAITEAEGHQADANIVRAARELLGTVNSLSSTRPRRAVPPSPMGICRRFGNWPWHSRIKTVPAITKRCGRTRSLSFIV